MWAGFFSLRRRVDPYNRGLDSIPWFCWWRVRVAARIGSRQARSETSRERFFGLHGFGDRRDWSQSTDQPLPLPYVDALRSAGAGFTGEEHPIDFRAWQPISCWELRQWFDRRFPRLTVTQQEVAAQFLLELAEHGRVRGREGLPIGNFGRVFGPLAIPLFHTYRPIWNQPTDVPAAPFLGLRWYRITWDRAAWSDPERVWRAETPTAELHYEYFARP